MPVNFQQLAGISQPQVVGQEAITTQQGLGGRLGTALKGLSNLVNPTENKEQISPQQSNPTSVNNPNTLGSLGASPNKDSKTNIKSPYNTLAESFLGQNEVNGQKALSNFFQKSLGQNIDPKTVPWCGAFVGSVLKANGQDIPQNPLAARSYLNFGQPTDKPQVGDLVVLRRGNDNRFGHVGFYNGVNEQGQPMILGGNQNNSVSVKAFDPSQVLGYRTAPTTQELQSKPSPKIMTQMATMRAQKDPQYAAKISQELNWNPNNQQSTGVDMKNYYQDKNAPRGLRNNNPGNLEKTNGKWGAEVDGKDSRFATYATPEAGLNALSNLLINKYNGLSLEKIISKYAPSHENDTNSYIKNLASSAGIDSKTPLNLNDPNIRIPVMKGIIKIENGFQPYPDSMFLSNNNISSNSVNEKPEHLSQLAANVPNQDVPVTPYKPGDSMDGNTTPLMHQWREANQPVNPVKIADYGGINWELLQSLNKIRQA